MKTYYITKGTNGYLIRDYPEHHGMACNEIYAFSTLKEARDYLPKLFEPKPTKQPRKANQ